MERAYAKSRTALMVADDRWVRSMIREQDKALSVLKRVAPHLYDAAVQPDASYLPFVARGPVLTPPIDNYAPPDGEYTDTTRAWQ